MTDITRLSILIDGKKAVAEIQKINSGLSGLGKNASGGTKDVSSLISSFKGFAGPAAVVAGVAASLKVMFSIIKAGIKDSAELEASQLKLQAVLRATGTAAQRSSAQIRKLSEDIESSSLFSTQDIEGAAGILATFKNIQGVTFDNTLKSAVDLSAVMGQDLKSSVVQLGKALNDPITGLTALQRVGVSFTASQKEQIKTLVAQNKVLEAQKIILAELNSEFGGGAAATQKGILGTFNALEDSSSRFKRNFAEAFLSSQDVVRAVKLITEFLDKITPSSQTERNTIFTAQIKDADQATRTITKLGTEMAETRRKLNQITEEVLNPKNQGRDTNISNLRQRQTELKKVLKDQESRLLATGQVLKEFNRTSTTINNTIATNAVSTSQKIINALREEVVVFGFTREAMERRRLELENGTEAQFRELDVLQKRRKELENIRDALAKLRTFLNGDTTVNADSQRALATFTKSAENALKSSLGRLNSANTENTTSIKETLSGLQLQATQLQFTSKEWELYQLQLKGASQVQLEMAGFLIDTIEAQQQSRVEFEAFRNVIRGTQDSMSSFFNDILSGSANGKNAFEQFVNSTISLLRRLVSEFLAFKAITGIQSLFGGGKAATTSSSIFSGNAASGFNGNKASNVTQNLSFNINALDTRSFVNFVNEPANAIGLASAVVTGNKRLGVK